MESLLFLAHRIPLPPNKGDKIRSFHWLRHLASRYRVHLGTFVDSSDDEACVPELSRYCASYHAVRLHPRQARIRSLTGLARGAPLTVPYYSSASLRRWVRETVATQGVRHALVFSSAMAQFVTGLDGLRVTVDFVDVDSAKWAQYATERPWPWSAVFRREGQRLLQFEREVAARADACLLATQAEVDLFARLAPETAGRVAAVCNGVDSEFFAPSDGRASPYAANECALVFTGVMDYWPNIDAVSWFARDILPAIAAARPDVRFYIVGMNPTTAVRALASDPRVVVTGKVPDVRPFLQHAAAVVAPLRVARGVQNKILEAMAMARPVVTSTAAGQGIAARRGVEFDCAAEPSEYAAAVLRVLDPAIGAAMGSAARARVQESFSWDSSVRALEALIAGPGGRAALRSA